MKSYAAFLPGIGFTWAQTLHAKLSRHWYIFMIHIVQATLAQHHQLRWHSGTEALLQWQVAQWLGFPSSSDGQQAHLIGMPPEYNLVASTGYWANSQAYRCWGMPGIDEWDDPQTLDLAPFYSFDFPNIKLLLLFSNSIPVHHYFRILVEWKSKLSCGNFALADSPKMLSNPLWKYLCHLHFVPMAANERTPVITRDRVWIPLYFFKLKRDLDPKVASRAPWG